MDTGNNAWVLTSAALILFMTPGLAFFYGGMVRSKNVLGMLMQNVFAIGLISVIWAVVGFSLAFGGDSSLIGNLDFAGMKDVATSGRSRARARCSPGCCSAPCRSPWASRR